MEKYKMIWTQIRKLLKIEDRDDPMCVGDDASEPTYKLEVFEEEMETNDLDSEDCSALRRRYHGAAEGEDEAEDEGAGDDGQEDDENVMSPSVADTSDLLDAAFWKLPPKSSSKGMSKKVLRADSTLRWTRSMVMSTQRGFATKTVEFQKRVMWSCGFTRPIIGMGRR